MATVVLKPGKERRLRAGHAWVYAGEVAKITGTVADGDAVAVRDAKGRPLGRGLLNRQSQIVVRRYTSGGEDFDEAWLRERIRAAESYRLAVYGGEVTSYRLVFGESDLVPGLVVDRYGDCLVMQALTLGVERRKREVLAILEREFGPRAIVERSDVHTRELEGLQPVKGVVAGRLDGPVEIECAGLRWEVDLLEDQKTGFFLDQRDNYRCVAAWAAGRRVLDCFSYHGGFGLVTAAAGAKSVELVEISESAVARARRNAERNGLLGRVEFVCANAFDVLKQWDKERKRYELIVLDPPSFTRTKDRVGEAVRGYKEINLRALKMLEAGGLLATFTCSHHVGWALFEAIVRDAAADARRTVRLVQRLTQARDHPVALGIEETEYLRGLLLQVMA
ncbi:MAG: class I SAM-dependent rRNA methyltransferase [Verrucomicrobiae bacterium]|nr:class I SAM-dependent rRNA methyltransferase [Verrucomicrobiae bacterium]MDW8343268.1 class I SAM-dependent rRNA methyltransferase [Verrucomicrobiae bacterium]